MTAKEIATAAGMVGLLVYQLSVKDITGAVQSLILVLGYFGVISKASVVNDLLVDNNRRLMNVERRMA